MRQLAEDGRIAVRNTRRKLMQELGRLERDSKVSSDEQHWLEQDIQAMTDRYITEVDELLADKKP